MLPSSIVSQRRVRFEPGELRNERASPKGMVELLTDMHTMQTAMADLATHMEQLESSQHSSTSNGNIAAQTHQ
eukprot:c3196_g2_i1 orf=51-269(-)